MYTVNKRVYTKSSSIATIPSLFMYFFLILKGLPSVVGLNTYEKNQPY